MLLYHLLGHREIDFHHVRPQPQQNPLATCKPIRTGEHLVPHPYLYLKTWLFPTLNFYRAQIN